MDGSKLRIALACAAAMAATVLAPAGVGRAAPSGKADALSTIHALEADGYRVIVNRSGMGSAPLYDCSVSGVRPGADESIVLVDVNCNRDA